MDKPFTIYGARGAGSVPVEAALTLAGAPYRLIEEPSLSAPLRDRRAGAVNPLRQVPALVLPDGEVMTESAAILIWLAERFPEARLAPPPGDPARPAFLRWMAYVSAAIYSLYWIRDDLSRLAADAAHEAVLAERTTERIAFCWGRMDAQVAPAPFILGETLGVLDLYVAVVSRWGPRRARFYREAPRLAEVVRRVDAEPRLQAFWAERFPFAPGWEGTAP